MEKIEKKYEILLKALSTLEEIISREKKEYGSNLYTTERDATIKRFEYCHDILWKYLKLFLEKNMESQQIHQKQFFGNVTRQELLLKKKQKRY